MTTFTRLPEEIKLPDSFDWREKRAVSRVKDQGQCGSCWAFAGVSTIESATFIKTGILFDLSEQQAVDCSRAFGNQGCQGGWIVSI